MTRTDSMVSSRPQAVGAASISQMTGRRSANGSPGCRARRRIIRRELLALPVVLALIVPAAPALAQTSTGTSSTGTSGYNQKPPTPTTKTEPKKAVEPSKEATTPTTSVTPTTTTPATSTAPTASTPKAPTLPFTGLNLTWVVGAGLLLLVAGLSIRIALRQRPGA
ncbi:MAG TPA: hypothetical protein VNY52_06695 [Solirubrobacteraceae bacterium]|jgi:hypothetical protein|nr:hypothetical protein [Solirubrobacteraceae bacterium]